MTVRAMLERGNYEVKTIGPKVKVETAAALLHENRIGALPVVDERGRLIGIVSERDIVGIIARRGSSALAATVDEVMTRHVVTMTCDDTVREVMEVMNSRRIRHLPILEGDRLKAMVSIRDVVKYRLSSIEMERNVLRDYAFAARA